MINKMVVGLIILITIGNVSAYSGGTSYSFNGSGVPEYPNVGHIHIRMSSTMENDNNCINSVVYDTNGNSVKYTWDGYASAYRGDCTRGSSTLYRRDGAGALTEHVSAAPPYWQSRRECLEYSTITTSNFGMRSCAGSGSCYGESTSDAHVSGTLTISDYIFSLSGNVTCLSGNVELYNDDTKIGHYTIYDDKYEFNNLIEDFNYCVKYPNDVWYNFTCTGNEIHDIDACRYLIINLKDYCGNKMTNTSVDIYKSDGGAMDTYEFVGTYLRINPIEILIDTDIEEDKMLDIYMDTDMGAYHVIDYCVEKSISILHPSKYWTMAYGAFDIGTSAPILGVRVTANQTCVINPDHPLKQYLFTGADGYGTFIGLSGDRIDVMMGHPDYYGNEDSNFFINIPCDAFQTAYSIDTYLNASSSDFVDENQTENLTEGCSVWFRDQTGKRDRHINDTDTYVDMYYKNANCTSTLKFQRLYSTYWMTKMSFNIPALESGHKRIYNVNFSDADASYRGYMYASECECNSTRSLYISNVTIEEEQHYQNLTAHCKFKHQMGGGQVDYRSDVEILAYAYSNTSHTLLNINLTLYNKTVLMASKQCDWSDFAGASPKWFYVWSPNVEYGIGNNYTVVMTGYNGLNLDADDVWTSNIRNNKLTVHVKDNHDTPVTHSTLFVQGWGSHTMDSASTFIITGLQDEVYQYKATKNGYTSSGWASINFTGTDQTVTCILIAQETDSITGYKLKDSEVKAFFIPLMYLLLIMILIGGVMNAAKR